MDRGLCWLRGACRVRGTRLVGAFFFFLILGGWVFVGQSILFFFDFSLFRIVLRSTSNSV